MTVAIVRLNQNANHILNIVKAKYDLRDKSEAINKMAEEYEKELLEPQLKPEYVEKLKKIQKQKPVKVGSFENFVNRYK